MCLEGLEVLEILEITQTHLQLAYGGNSAQPLYAYPSILSFLLFRCNDSRGGTVKALKMWTKSSSVQHGQMNLYCNYLHAL